MAERTYLTKQGEMVDWIAWRVYGYSTGSTEAIYERNRHIALSDQPTVLPAGLTIILPNLPRPLAAKAVRLWD